MRPNYNPDNIIPDVGTLKFTDYKVFDNIINKYLFDYFNRSLRNSLGYIEMYNPILICQSGQVMKFDTDNNMIFMKNTMSPKFGLRRILLNNQRIVDDVKNKIKTFLNKYISGITEIKLLIKNEPELSGIGIIIVQSSIPLTIENYANIASFFTNEKDLNNYCKSSKKYRRNMQIRRLLVEFNQEKIQL